MGTTYRTTIHLRCWKEHTCVHCGGTFAYLLMRKVAGQGGTTGAAEAAARTLASKALQHDLEQHPCPTCGLYQPDMVGAVKVRWHWYLFWGTLAALALVLITHSFDLVAADAALWLAAGIGAVAVLGHFVVDWRNPNSDPDANLQRARDQQERGNLQVGQAGRSEPPPLELRSPLWSAFHRLLYVLLALAVAGIPVPELVRRVQGWPFNPDWHPPVAGPGDQPYCWLPDRIRSVKGYWKGIAKVQAFDAAQPNAPGVTIQASTSADSWGDSISVKSSEKDSSSHLWVRVHLPDDPKLAGKTLTCHVELAIIYPKAQGNTYDLEQQTFQRTVSLQLAPLHAGGEYVALWWAAFVGGGGLLLLGSGCLIAVAQSLKRQAPPTKIYSAEEPPPPPQDDENPFANLPSA